MVKKQDEIYASPLNEIIDFDFDEKVLDAGPTRTGKSSRSLAAAYDPTNNRNPELAYFICGRELQQYSPTFKYKQLLHRQNLYWFRNNRILSQPHKYNSVILHA